MATMSAAGDRGDELFTGLVVSNPTRGRAWFGFWESLGAHVVLITALVLASMLWPVADPEHPDYIRALIYNPPPPPPPPLPKGAAMIEDVKPPQKVTPEAQERPKFEAPVEPQEAPLEPEPGAPETEQAGSPTGSDFGDAAGMDIGVEGGVLGGVPGGVLGGVVGGTGDGPVPDYDQPPRLIRQVQPEYPPEAFVKKIEGVVEIEILIDREGRVRPVRVLHSIPALNAAAIQCVKQWVFAPALKHGRPVPTLAVAPVSFRIF